VGFAEQHGAGTRQFLDEGSVTRPHTAGIERRTPGSGEGSGFEDVFGAEGHAAQGTGCRARAGGNRRPGVDAGIQFRDAAEAKSVLFLGTPFTGLKKGQENSDQTTLCYEMRCHLSTMIFY
jgi:hypothetical protein